MAYKSELEALILGALRRGLCMATGLRWQFGEERRGTEDGRQPDLSNSPSS